MGIDIALFERLCELSSRFQPEGRKVMLGRQGYKVLQRYRPFYKQALREHGVKAKLFETVQPDEYSETFFEKLGLGKMEAMDFSDYEGATLLHDLNTLPRKGLREKFDFIFDGGTIEHVFHVPNALAGVYMMLKPGGRFVSANGFNGWGAHGLYQFGPDLVWSFWKRACNCKVHDCRLMPVHPDSAYSPVVIDDPAETRRRPRLRGKIGSSRFYLYYEVEKTEDSHPPTFTLQSDYEAKWHGSKNASQTSMDQ